MLMCMISWMIRPPCEITDQLAVGTQNCFSTLFYTPYTNITTSAQYAPKCTIARQKNQKKMSGGTAPSSTKEGDTPSHTLPFGARRSRFFSFTSPTLLTSIANQMRAYLVIWTRSLLLNKENGLRFIRLCC